MFARIAAMKTQLTLKTLLAVALSTATGLMAGEPMTLNSKSGKACESCNAAPAAYEANRGLLTLEGPSGMFINPTSATLPKGAFTAQYCFFLPDFNFDGTIGHGGMASYGVTDWLEVGALLGFLTDTPDTQFSAGPMVRARLLKHDGLIPQLSVGSYGYLGDNESASTFLALTERFELGGGCPLKSIAFHAGARQTWTENNDSFRGYFGAELELPGRVYLVGELATKSSVDAVVPWAAGVQWRAGGINISTAVVENGNGGDVGFFFGIGTVF